MTTDTPQRVSEEEIEAVGKCIREMEAQDENFDPFDYSMVWQLIMKLKADLAAAEEREIIAFESGKIDSIKAMRDVEKEIDSRHDNPSWRNFSNEVENRIEDVNFYDYKNRNKI